MIVDDNFARMILRNPRKITVDKNHTCDKMRFFLNYSLFGHVQKNHSTMTRLTSLVIRSNLSHSPTDHSKDAKKRIENDPVTWVNEPLFPGRICYLTEKSLKTLQKNELKLGHFVVRVDSG